MNRKEFKLRNEIKRLQNVLDYKKTMWEVNYMKSKSRVERLPIRNWKATGEQTKHLLHEAKEVSSRGISRINARLPYVERRMKLPKANLEQYHNYSDNKPKLLNRLELSKIATSSRKETSSDSRAYARRVLREKYGY